MIRLLSEVLILAVNADDANSENQVSDRNLVSVNQEFPLASEAVISNQSKYRTRVDYQ